MSSRPSSPATRSDPGPPVIRLSPVIAFEHVAAGATLDDVAPPFVEVQIVVTAPTSTSFPTGPPPLVITSCPARRRVGHCRPYRRRRRCLLRRTLDLVLQPDEAVVAWSATEHVVALPPDDHVVPSQSDDDVIPRVPRDHVIASAPDDRRELASASRCCSGGSRIGGIDVPCSGREPGPGSASRSGRGAVGRCRRRAPTMPRRHEMRLDASTTMVCGWRYRVRSAASVRWVRSANFIRPSRAHAHGGARRRCWRAGRWLGVAGSRDRRVRMHGVAQRSSGLDPDAASSASSSGCRSCRHAPAPIDPDLKGFEHIQHVIFIVQENRSFDHYFGTFPGADGIPMKRGRVRRVRPRPGDRRRARARTTPTNSSTSAARTRPTTRSATSTAAAWTASSSSWSRPPNRCGRRPERRRSAARRSARRDTRRHELPRRPARSRTTGRGPRRFVLQDRMFAPTDSWTLPAHLFLVSAWSAHCTDPHDPMSCRSDIDLDRHARRPDATARIRRSTRGPTSRSCSTRPA